MSTVQVDAINESTTNAGVTVDGVLIKDNAVNTDTITEKTSGSGVTIDSVLLNSRLLQNLVYLHSIIENLKGDSVPFFIKNI